MYADLEKELADLKEHLAVTDEYKHRMEHRLMQLEEELQAARSMEPSVQKLAELHMKLEQHAQVVRQLEQSIFDLGQKVAAKTPFPTNYPRRRLRIH